MHHKIVMKFFSVILVKIELYAWNPTNGKTVLLDEDSSNLANLSDDRLAVREMTFTDDDKNHAKTVFRLLRQKFYDERDNAHEKKMKNMEIDRQLM